MKRWSLAARLWFYRGLTLLATAAIVHVLAVWAVPRLIMQRLMHGPALSALAPQGGAAFPAPVDASARRVVMPSPDLLYAVCVYDLANGPVRITAQPALPTYWSIALYAANSDNFLVINDRQTGLDRVDLWLVAQDGHPAAPPVPAGTRVVVSPTREGFVLMRVLTADYAREAAVLEPARRTLACMPAAR